MIKIYKDGKLDRIELTKVEKYDLCKKNLKMLKEQKDAENLAGK